MQLLFYMVYYNVLIVIKKRVFANAILRDTEEKTLLNSHSVVYTTVNKLLFFLYTNLLF
jgi:hypothetical protein